ncbi:MAG: heme-binding domain-containing protein [Bacteroidales bacterium]|nr:heme-binding domain-containing protein [Bacteroidales bacterium]
MKNHLNRLFVLLPVVAVFVIVLSSFDTNSITRSGPGNQEDTFVIPDDIQGIFDKSCFGCHNVDSKSDKARKKLLLDQLHDLSKAKLVAALGDIKDIVGEGKMPPDKFLENYPDKALTPEEADKLKAWAEKTADELVN